MHREDESESNEKDPLTHAVIGAAIEVHRHLGPGLLESVYEKCLCYEFDLRGLPYRKQVELPLVYKEFRPERALRIDLLVADRLILELKAVEKVDPLHEAQLLTYLRLTGLKLGLIVNFKVTVLKNGLKRMVL
jgi:GxxExxY protein